ncbi:MAG TPA: PEP-CTERM sorting domain-containing protein [Phycisphaerae bacterium]|nr:PEP-CTERM sorting domain-containing protein [Phycisphaerae bacterium]
MKTKLMSSLVAAAASAAGIGVGALASAPAYGVTIDYAESNYGQGETSGVTLGDQSNLVVTSILSQPGTFNGKSYTKWAYFANDGTGSADIYGTMPDSYTPTVGDQLQMTGDWYPDDQIPEEESLSSVTVDSQNNAIPTITSATVTQVNTTTLPVGAPPINYYANSGSAVAGYLFWFNGVTISAGANTLPSTWGITNETLTVTDATGSMVLFYWPTSYSVPNVNLYGTNIGLTGSPVGILGFVDVFGSGASAEAELIPIDITPEPGPLALMAVGGMLALCRRRRWRSG